MLYFGIDAATYATRPLLTSVADSIGVARFVGRYLPTYGVTHDEVALLKDLNCPILCVWNEDQNGSQMGGTHDAGYAAGVRAASAWADMGAPANTAVYLDVEQAFYVSPDYLAGFFEGVQSRGLVGGCYINSLAGNGHNEAYAAARQRTTAPSVIFASEPQPYALANRVATEWAPAAPAGYDSHVGIWQYYINAIGGSVDLDLCNDLGWAHLWHHTPPTPPTPKPQTWRVVTPGTLKSQPSHASSPAIGPNKQPVYLEVGAQITPTGNTKHTDDNWTELRLVRPEAVVHGWFPTGYLRAT